MPIDQHLSGLEDSNTKVKLKNSLPSPFNLILPADQLAFLLLEFRTIVKEIPPNSYLDMYTASILTVVERFHPYIVFYSDVCNSFQKLCSELNNWQSSFNLLPSINNNDTTIANSLYDWIIKEVNAAYSDINKASQKSKYNCSSLPWLTDVCEKIDLISNELQTTQNLSKVVSMGSGLNTLVSKLHQQYIMYKGYEINPSNFIAYLNSIKQFSQNKTMIKLNTYYDYTSSFKDLSPKPKKWWNI